MVVSLLLILISVPRLFRDVTEAICHCSDPSLKTLNDLASRARKIRKALKVWQSIYLGSDETPDPKLELCDGYYKVLILFYISSIYSNRLNTCIFWNETTDVMEMENESQRFADVIVSLSNDE